jgi:serine/threonine protein kinase/Tfp pilus assembly protein PilF
MSESVAAEAAAADLDRLAAEVVAEITDRLHAGARVDVNEYIGRHPQLGDRLRRLLPALEMLDSVASSAGPSQAGSAAPGGVGLDGTLGDFRLLREIGRGGMGVVYEAEQLSLGRRVALKVLPFAGALDARQLQRFRTESRAAAQLHHTNIVPVYSVGCERGVHFYAMQYINGHSLSAVLAQLRDFAGPDSGGNLDARTESGAGAFTTLLQPLPGFTTGTSTGDPAFFRAVAGLGVQVAEALDHAHRQGIVHRDVKPANLLVDGHANVWVTDFGLAQVRNDVRMTATGDLIGTLRYMSPEQALSQRATVDHRTDIYSLGATLYELLTQQPVFGGADRQALLRQIAFDEPIPPRRLNASLPADLETIVLKALAKSPNERYATAQELADDLRSFIDDKPIRARRPGVRKRVQRWARRHKPLVACVIVFVFTALLMRGIGFIRQERERAATEAAVAEDLREAERWQAREHWADARQALERADGRLAGGGPPHLRARIEQMRDEVCLAPALEEARLELWEIAADNFDYVRADKAYHSAFREHHLDLTQLDADAAAQRIRASAIRTHVVVALDNWSFIKEHLHRGDGEPLRKIARLADDDPWRERLRTSLVSGDQEALKQLAESPDALAQPPVNVGLLTTVLIRADALEAAERLLRQAQKKHPSDFWINFRLADILRTRKPAAGEEAVGYYRAALAVRPNSPFAHNSLGAALWALGKPADAEAACRKALDLKADYAGAWNNLGLTLYDQDRLEEAEHAYHEATRFKPDFAEAFNNLGIVQWRQGRPRLAEAAYSKAISCKQHFADALNNLGLLFSDQERYSEAIAAFHQALEARPRMAAGQVNLAWVLICLDKPDEAADRCRQAIASQPNFAQAHSVLGIALFSQGRFVDALASLRRGKELASSKGGSDDRSSQWLRMAERLATIETRLPQVISGECKPADASECILFARICQKREGLHATSARLYALAFSMATESERARVLMCRYAAACSAVLAGCGRSKDAAKLDTKARTGLRRQALTWLRQELARCRQAVEASSGSQAKVYQIMESWQNDIDFNDVRDPEALALLPEPERRRWEEFWQGVEQVRQQVAP